MSKHDLAARPIYHHLRESIEAHLSIVVAALAVTHWIETRTGWSIKKFVRTARRYRTITIAAGNHTLTAADPLPDDLHHALTKIRGDDAHKIEPTRVVDGARRQTATSVRSSGSASRRGPVAPCSTCCGLPGRQGRIRSAGQGTGRQVRRPVQPAGVASGVSCCAKIPRDLPVSGDLRPTPCVRKDKSGPVSGLCDQS